MPSPTKKQIELVEKITQVLDIDFPISSREFTRKTYYRFIKTNYEEFKRIVNDINDIGEDDEMAWFSPINN